MVYKKCADCLLVTQVDAGPEWLCVPAERGTRRIVALSSSQGLCEEIRHQAPQRLAFTLLQPLEIPEDRRIQIQGRPWHDA